MEAPEYEGKLRDSQGARRGVQDLMFGAEAMPASVEGICLVIKNHC